MEGTEEGATNRLARECNPFNNSVNGTHSPTTVTYYLK